MDDIRKKYGLDGPLAKIHEKTVEKKDIFIQEVEKNNVAKEQRKREFDQYNRITIISPMHGYGDLESKPKINNSNLINISPVIKNRSTYKTLNEYIEETVQNKITKQLEKKNLNNSVSSNDDLQTSETNTNYSLKEDTNQYQIKFEKEIPQDLRSPTEIRIQTYLNRYQSIYDRAHKFHEEQKKDINIDKNSKK